MIMYGVLFVKKESSCSRFPHYKGKRVDVGFFPETFRNEVCKGFDYRIQELSIKGKRSGNHLFSLLKHNDKLKRLSSSHCNGLFS